jgi:hypothetical protein
MSSGCVRLDQRLAEDVPKLCFGDVKGKERRKSTNSMKSPWLPRFAHVGIQSVPGRSFTAATTAFPRHLTDMLSPKSATKAPRHLSLIHHLPLQLLFAP